MSTSRENALNGFYKDLYGTVVTITDSLVLTAYDGFSLTAIKRLDIAKDRKVIVGENLGEGSFNPGKYSAMAYTKEKNLHFLCHIVYKAESPAQALQQYEDSLANGKLNFTDKLGGCGGFPPTSIVRDLPTFFLKGVWTTQE